MKKRHRIPLFFEWCQTPAGAGVKSHILQTANDGEKQLLIAELLKAGNSCRNDRRYPGHYLADPYSRRTAAHQISIMLLQCSPTVWPECWPKQYAERQVQEYIAS